MIKTSPLSNLVAGFVAVMVGFTSTAVLVFQAAAAVGANSAEVSSWLLALGIGMGVSCIGLSWYYRAPILIAWSTPGAALLAGSLNGFSLAEATGAFIFSAILITLSGLTGWFEKAMDHIPKALTSAMLAGILLHFGLDVFVAMQKQSLLIGLMLVVYLLGKRFFPRYVILSLLVIGGIVAKLQGLFQFNDFHVVLSKPIFTAPVFTGSALMSLGVPLFIVTMASQNLPGVATLHASGYKPPISPLITWTGLLTMLLAPWGAYALNLAAITAAICMGDEAHPNPAKRYRAAMYAGLFYLITGFFGATVVVLFTAFPKELILAVAGLALLSPIANSLKAAIEDEAQREAALITFLLSASGISLFGIGAAFWGLISGILSLMLLNSRKSRLERA
ncbi:benzoate/H(+) symporter BenE family transporter [Legionella jordanis]|uniref:Inner membrane protein YdcO n=1 Tax=Legionella jordanis TaxID=456 RepID=A0A0W0VEM5_9GAMM|nr:benzoate/H(+) symporter BenE family transporter [Legionella jordanis]KTD18089.1 Inner membrane protein YdcO [Legionella jordanis]RMX00597.1 benzoate transporter BenE [Legionella jordanis]RMX21287.1 benzoate transporter BenE [Legionella jordanis]VEH13819.1 Inner membrane protein ydcO [Legionella jordanis]